MCGARSLRASCAPVATAAFAPGPPGLRELRECPAQHHPPPGPVRWWNSLAGTIVALIRSRIVELPTDARRAMISKMRRSRSGCPVRLRSARESDLRASSPAFTGHYGVELRRRFVRTLLDLHRSASDYAPRASRRSPVVVAVDVLASYVPHQPRAIGKTSKLTLLHKNLRFSTSFRSNSRNPQPSKKSAPRK